jgi:serine/threonine-protein kinase
MPIAAGTRLGPYEIQSLVGVGGMGDVQGARHGLNRTVAIKVLSEALRRPQLRERFSRGARDLVAEPSQHLRALRCRPRAGVDFLVMEYLEGQTVTG